MKLPFPHCFLLPIQEAHCRPLDHLRPPDCQLRRSSVAALFPLPLRLQVSGLVQTSHEMPFLRIPPALLVEENAGSTTKKPPSSCRLGTSHPPPTGRPHTISSGSARPKPMQKSYEAHRARAHKPRLPDWATDARTTPYYKHSTSLSPRSFIGLGQFAAGRIHQIRAAKTYMAPQCSSFHENPNTTCPHCKTEPESFEQVILTCPTGSRARDLWLKDVSSLKPDAPLWTDPHHTQALDQYITNTTTGLPAGHDVQTHQQNVKTTPGPPRGVTVPLVLLVYRDPP